MLLRAKEVIELFDAAEMLNPCVFDPAAWPHVSHRAYEAAIQLIGYARIARAKRLGQQTGYRGYLGGMV